MPLTAKQKHLTRNFHIDEWRCKDKRRTPVPEKYYANVLRCARNLQVLRDDINYHKRPKLAPAGVDIAIHINSGYRTPEWNDQVGGADASKHMIALAADITCKWLTPRQIANRIERLIREGKMMEGGLEVYPGFTHYDPRGTKARW